jgi:hypothetical protein
VFNVKAVVGEAAVFKRRGDNDAVAGLLQRRPKRLHFLVDVSASILRYDEEDGRLARTAATVTMILQSFSDFQYKYVPTF